MTLKVIQWTTGNVGREMLAAIIDHPKLELVGVFAWSDDKVGVDAGELCGRPATGVLATNDEASLLALRADCVSYNPLWPDIDQMCRILESGCNMVSTAAFITGHSQGELAQAKLKAACAQGESTLYGSGMNPGLANIIALIATGGCSQVNYIKVLESVDATGYASKETQESVGFGLPADHPDLHSLVAQGTAVFKDAVYLMADALEVELSALRLETNFAVATKDHDLGFMQINTGCIAGVAASWIGDVDGKPMIESRVQWIMGKHMEPEFDLQHGYLVEIDGMPNIRSKTQILPPKDFVAESFQDYMRLGMVMTGMPALNAVEFVCRSAPGILTAADMPLRALTGRGLT